MNVCHVIVLYSSIVLHIKSIFQTNSAGSNIIILDEKNYPIDVTNKSDVN